MAKYCKSLKFSTSGETYNLLDAEQKARLDNLEPTVAGKQDTLIQHLICPTNKIHWFQEQI